ncbi:MAG: glutathione S-transferase family protein, partial [Myxococcota bacterium]
SWSLRPWLLLSELGVPFEEEKISFNDPNWKTRFFEASPSGRVPVLVDGEVAVWDSLAIAEYVAERFPEAGVWPAHPEARALARSIVAEMHAGFSALRARMPMNIEAHLPGRGWDLTVQKDIDRILALWKDARTRFGAEGPMLFGRFSAADAFYAPVVWRFVTHDVQVDDGARAYMDAVRALPSMQAWAQEALEEHDYVADDEPYRPAPNGG